MLNGSKAKYGFAQRKRMKSSEIDEPKEIQREIAEFSKDFPTCPFKIIEKIGQGRSNI